MKYTIDVKTLKGFAQFISQPESGNGPVSPHISQYHTGQHPAVLERMLAVVTEAEAKVKWVDDNFHDDDEARRAFEGGFSIFKQGEAPITCMVQRRVGVILVGSVVAFESVTNFAAVAKELKKAISVLCAD